MLKKIIKAKRFKMRRFSKKLFIAISIGFIVSLTCCDVFFTMKIINKTDRPISVAIWWDTIPRTEYGNSAEFYLYNILEPAKTEMQSRRGTIGSYDEYKLTFVVYDKDTLLKYRNMPYIDTNRLYIRQFTLSYRELKRKNWEVEIK